MGGFFSFSTTEVDRACHALQNNVLLDSNGHPKISDYGLARHSDSVPTGASGVFYAFAAPELIQDDDRFAIRTEKTDIFSFGRLFYQVRCIPCPGPCILNWVA